MIKGVHTMFYSSEPEALRAFLRDKLGFSSYSDVGGGWAHLRSPGGGHGRTPVRRAGASTVSRRARTTFRSTARTSGPPSPSSKAAGVVFDSEVADAGFGLATRFTMPGGVRAQLYQPYYRKGAG